MPKALPTDKPEKVCPGCGFKYRTAGSYMNHVQYGVNGCTEQARFWGKASKEHGCWIWTGATDQHGYGRINSRAQGNYYAHRKAWELTNGDIPKGQHVLHKCDTPACVNPAHMFLGTHLDNMKDKWLKGRATGTRKLRPTDTTGAKE